MRNNKSYENWEGLVWDRVVSWNASTGMEKDQLLSVAMEAYVKARDSFDPAKAKFSTWLRRQIDQAINRYIQHCCRRPLAIVADVGEDMPSEKAAHMPDVVAGFRDLLMGLSKEAKEVATIILSGPLEIMDLQPEIPVRRVKKFLYKHLRSQGWRRKEIHGAFEEIGQALEA